MLMSVAQVTTEGCPLPVLPPEAMLMSVVNLASGSCVDAHG